MKDIINSIKVHLHEKSTSPLFGAFSLSWIGWNYKFILVLLSELKINEKIEFIESILYPNIIDNFLFGLVYPFVTAVIFILLYPFPAELIFSYWKNKQKKMNEIRQRIEGEMLLSIDDSREIRGKIDELEQLQFKELEIRNNKISTLQEEIDQELETSKTYKQQQEKIKDEEIQNLNNALESFKSKSVHELELLSAKNAKLEKNLKILKKEQAKHEAPSNLERNIQNEINDFEINQKKYMSFLSYLRANGKSLQLEVFNNAKVKEDPESSLLLGNLLKAFLIDYPAKSRSNVYYTITNKGNKFLNSYEKTTGQTVKSDFSDYD